LRALQKPAHEENAHGAPARRRGDGGVRGPCEAQSAAPEAHAPDLRGDEPDERSSLVDGYERADLRVGPGLIQQGSLEERRERRLCAARPDLERLPEEGSDRAQVRSLERPDGCPSREPTIFPLRKSAVSHRRCGPGRFAQGAGLRHPLFNERVAQDYVRSGITSLAPSPAMPSVSAGTSQTSRASWLGYDPSHPRSSWHQAAARSRPRPRRRPNQVVVLLPHDPPRGGPCAAPGARARQPTRATDASPPGTRSRCPG
jgi:hypothetical protein